MSRKVLIVLFAWTFLNVWLTSSESEGFVKSGNDVRYSGESGNVGPVTFYVKTDLLEMQLNARENPKYSQESRDATFLTTFTVTASADGSTPKFESVEGGYKVTVFVTLLHPNDSNRLDITFKDASLTPLVDENQNSTWIWVSVIGETSLVIIIFCTFMMVIGCKHWRQIKAIKAEHEELRKSYPTIQELQMQLAFEFAVLKTPMVQADKKTTEKLPASKTPVKKTAYETTLDKAKSRAQLLGEKLRKKDVLHVDFLRDRHPPTSKEYTVDEQAPLKEFISDEVAIEVKHPLLIKPMFAVVVQLLSLPKWSQRFEIYFKLQPLAIVNTLKRAQSQMAKYRDSFKKGLTNYRLPYSFQTGEEFGMLDRKQIVFALCHEPIDQEQLNELERIVKQMEYRLRVRKAANETERTPRDKEIDKMKESQIRTVRSFMEMTSTLIAINTKKNVGTALERLLRFVVKLLASLLPLCCSCDLNKPWTFGVKVSIKWITKYATVTYSHYCSLLLATNLITLRLLCNRLPCRLYLFLAKLSCELNEPMTTEQPLLLFRLHRNLEAVTFENSIDPVSGDWWSKPAQVEAPFKNILNALVDLFASILKFALNNPIVIALLVVAALIIFCVFKAYLLPKSFTFSSIKRTIPIRRPFSTPRRKSHVL
ncbi:hypothetical protein M3Y98_00337700 [Aphelenchoides besseyi]|nr:hypothetical protein M3Y98_00337700 [Aphelenchoides besseyi]